MHLRYKINRNGILFQRFSALQTNSTDREKTFEITKTIFQTVKGQNNFGNRMLGGFSDLIHSNSSKKKLGFRNINAGKVM